MTKKKTTSKKSTQVVSSVKDLFNGNNVTAWQDDDTVYLSIHWTTVAFPKEDWKEIKKELKKVK